MMLPPPDAFSYRDGSLYCEETPLDEIARRAGTPCYVYSSRAVMNRFRSYQTALEGLPHLISYAVKANSNLALLRLLATAGAGFDIVSGGELYRVLQAGGDPSRVVFSGVGKTPAEIEFALKSGIYAFNCESESEIHLIEALAARLGRRARIALRVNPDVDAGAHPYISTGLREHKFGIEMAEAEQIYHRAQSLPHLSLEGISCHIGSQILEVEPLLEALERLLELAARLRNAGLPVRHLDLGGGLGIPYRPTDRVPAIAEFAARVRRRMETEGLFPILEPGRSIVGEAGVLLTTVLYRKSGASREFIIVDAAMNDLLRPSLYQSHHEIFAVRQAMRGAVRADVVGPVCESGDFLALDREMPNALPGDVLAVATAGAYGFVLSSNYNSRPRPPEILVEGDRWRIVRSRETYEDLIRGETV
jgi:diaminopimelate decarboxylase